MKSHDARIRVRYKETDQMGIVHHSNYYVWFEVGRTEYMRDLGLEYREIEERGFMFPLLETHCSYKQGARYDDAVIIRTSLSSYKGVRISFDYQVIREADQVLLAEGRTVHAFVDMNMKPVNMKKVYPEVYRLLMQSVDETV